MRLADRKCWIFDLDGTLTVAAHDFDAIRAELGLLPGTPILEQLAERGLSEARQLLRRLGEIEREIARRARPQPGTSEFLEVLLGKAARIGLLTRNSRSNARMTLARCGLKQFFESRFILDRESCDPKPSADGIRKLLEKWRASPGEAVMVGDYRFDLEAGREAGTATIHIDTGGKNRWPELADATVRDLVELRILVETGRFAGVGPALRLPGPW